MLIDKMKEGQYELICESLKKYISAWFVVPDDIDVDVLGIDRIRFIKEWKGKEGKLKGAYIIEFSTCVEQYRELLTEEEIGLSTGEYEIMLQEQEKNYMGLAKSILVNDGWHSFPVVWGSIDKLFDNEKEYV